MASVRYPIISYHVIAAGQASWDFRSAILKALQQNIALSLRVAGLIHSNLNIAMTMAYS